MAQIQSILDPSKLLKDVDTDEEEDDVEVDMEFHSSENDLDEEDRLLQHTILRNFMGRSKEKNLLDTKIQFKMQRMSEELDALKNNRISNNLHGLYQNVGLSRGKRINSTAFNSSNKKASDCSNKLSQSQY